MNKGDVNYMWRSDMVNALAELGSLAGRAAAVIPADFTGNMTCESWELGAIRPLLVRMIEVINRILPQTPPDEEFVSDNASKIFTLSPEQWEAFMAALEQQPRIIPRLRRLLTEPSILDQKV